MKKMILGAQSNTALYKYEGVVRIKDEIVEDNAVLYTHATTSTRAFNNFKNQIARNRRVSYTDVSIDASKIVKVSKALVPRIEPTCKKCGTRLTDSGECPVCDLGETDI